jgi:ArsR family transcriptional regulator, arsenate/arsenite/antimonite-responsive transcriptional repressor
VNDRRLSSSQAGSPDTPGNKDRSSWRRTSLRSSNARIDRDRYVDTSIDVRQYEFMRREIALMKDCCTPLGPAPLSGDEAERMAAALRVLADPVRLQIVSLLAVTDEACVCDMTPSVGVSQPTVSHHMRVLFEAGLVEREQRGRWVYYRLRPEPLEAVAGALAPRSAFAPA